MQDITAPYEYVVAEKKTPKLRARRAGLIALYILFPIVALVITAMSKVGPLLAAMCTFLAIATWMLVFFTWRYVSVEYEYTVVSGRVTFCKIYGGRSRKKLLEFMIKDAELIAPTDDVNIGKVKYFEPEKHTAHFPPRAPRTDISCFSAMRRRKNAFSTSRRPPRCSKYAAFTIPARP